MFESFEDRQAQTSAAISQAINRMRPPVWFHSDSEYLSTLAAAFRDRAQFWDSVVQYCINGQSGKAEHVLFTALLDAREQCGHAAWEYEREARSSARSDQAEAFRSYADNIAASSAPAHLAAA